YNCNGRCILTVRNRISTNKSRKLHFITFMTLFVFDAENKYLTPKQTARILAPNDQLCAQEAHRLVLIRPNKVHLISTGDVYKRNLSKESYFTPSTSPPWAILKSCPRTSEIRLQTCTRLEWATKPSASSLVRSRLLLVRLF